MEDLIYATNCPCCGAYLTIDEAGDIQGEPVQEELADNEFIGLGGVKSVDARANWRQVEYFHNSQQPIPSERLPEVPEPMKVEEEQPQAHEHDDAMLAALKRDLDKHGINNKLTINDK